MEQQIPLYIKLFLSERLIKKSFTEMMTQLLITLFLYLISLGIYLGVPDSGMRAIAIFLSFGVMPITIFQFISYCYIRINNLENAVIGNTEIKKLYSIGSSIYAVVVVIIFILFKNLKS